MSFSDHKITQFTHRISELADQPNLPADELKARFDSSPEELRQGLNAVCDDAQTLSNKVDNIITQTFEGVVDKSMLAESLADELDAKATQTALSTEQTARESADSALNTRVTSAESTISTHTTQIAQKCRIYFGSYTGDGEISKSISLGFRPKAVLIFCRGSMGYLNGNVQGGLVLDGTPLTDSSAYDPAAEVTAAGFTVRSNVSSHRMNIADVMYHYLAFRV